MQAAHTVRARAPSRRAQAAFGVGAAASGVTAQAISAFALLYYNQVVGLSPATVGLAMMISLIADALWDPLIGLWSDRFRSRLGRRHPFMYTAAVPAGAAFWLLWNPPAGLTEVTGLVYLTATLMAVQFFTSLYEVPSTSLAPEMAPDYDARTSLLASRYLFGVLGGVLMSVLAFQVFLSDRAGGVTNAAGFAGYGLAGAAVITAAILISSLGTHGQIALLARPPARQAGLRDLMAPVAAALRNRNFVAIMVAALFSGLSGGVSRGLGMYFNLYFWELSTDDLSLLIFPSLLASLVGVAAAPYAARRWGKKRVVLILFSLSVFSSVLPMSLRLLGVLPGNDWPGLLPLLALDAFVSGALGLMGMIIVTSMLADVVEDDAARTGHRSEGLFFAANSVLNKCISGVGTFVSGLMLTWIAFPADARPGAVDAGLMHQLGYMYLPAAVLLAALSLITLSFFRIDRAQHEANLSRIESAALADEAVEAANPVGQRSP